LAAAAAAVLPLTHQTLQKLETLSKNFGRLKKVWLGCGGSRIHDTTRKKYYERKIEKN
jgi:hypothetical protein